MSETIARPEPDDPLLMQTRAFWRANARRMARSSLGALDGAAKQIIGVTGILEGLYFHAITFSGLRGQLSGAALCVYAAPVVFLLVSLAAALAIFFPDRYTINMNSSLGAKAVYERVLAGKLSSLRVAAIFLGLGVASILLAVLVYLQG